MQPGEGRWDSACTPVVVRTSMPCDRARTLADASRADLPMPASPRTTSAAPRSWTRPITSARTPVSRSCPTIGCTLDSPHHHPSIGTGGTHGLTCATRCTTYPIPCAASYHTNVSQQASCRFGRAASGRGNAGNTVSHCANAPARRAAAPRSCHGGMGTRGLRTPRGAGTHEGGEEPPAAFVVRVHGQLLGMVLHRQRERMIC